MSRGAEVRFDSEVEEIAPRRGENRGRAATVGRDDYYHGDEYSTGAEASRPGMRRMPSGTNIDEKYGYSPPERTIHNRRSGNRLRDMLEAEEESAKGSVRGSVRGSLRGSTTGRRRSPSPPWLGYVTDDDDGNVQIRRTRPRSRGRSPSVSVSPRRRMVINSYNYSPPPMPGYGSSRAYGGRYRSTNEFSAYDNARGEGSDDESNLSDDAYSFTLTRHKRINSNLDTSISDAANEAEDSNKTVSNPDLEKVRTPTVNPLKPPVVKYVFGSKYTGDGSIGGAQTAVLTVLPAPPQTAAAKKARQPLYRWAHFQDPSMNFDDFQGGINALPNLTDLERQAISRLLTRARKRFDKPFQTNTGLKARFFMPSFLTEVIASQTQQKGAKQRTVTWVCQPHFHLRKYTPSGQPGSGKPADHPLRTLMQARFALVNKERDMQQAVAQLKATKADHCFHIVQTWYLIMDDSLLITCSELSMSNLQGEGIKMKQEQISAIHHQHGGWPPGIVVSCGRCLLWYFKLEECESWFDFVSHFGEFWPRKLEFKHNGKLVGPGDWSKIVSLAAKTNVRLTLDHKPPNREKFEAPDDFPPINYDGRIPTNAKETKAKARRPSSSELPPPDEFPKPKRADSDGPRIVFVESKSGRIGASYSSKDFPTENSKVAASAPTSPKTTQGAFSPLSRVDSLKPQPVQRRDSLKPEPLGRRDSFTPQAMKRSNSMKPVNLADGFYIFTWLNAHPTSLASPPAPATPNPDANQRSTSRTRSISGDNPFCPPPRPEMQWEVDEEEVRGDLREVDLFLNRNTTVSDCVMYKETPEISRQEVFDALVHKKQKLLDATEKNDQEKLKVMENKATILAAADGVFQFFLPKDFEGPTVKKYWGAIYQLLFPNQDDKNAESDRMNYFSRAGAFERKRNYGVRDREVASIIEFLGSVVKQCQPFKELFSQAHSTDRLNLQLPEEFAKAWLYILICMAAATKDIMVFDTEINQVYDLIAKGMRKVVEENSKKSLLETMVFTPFELATLINFQLVEGSNNAFSEDPVEPYWNYLRSLESDIASSPLDRGHQDRIALFQQEVEICAETLEQQKTILMFASPSANRKNTHANGRPVNALGVAFNDGDPHYGVSAPKRPKTVPDYRTDYDGLAGNAWDTKAGRDHPEAYDVPVVVTNAMNPSSQLVPTHPSGVLGILIYDSLQLVDHKLRDLKEMNDWLEHLSSSSLQKIDTNKDRQEAAIYTFTIVTIVFLPLSTVASILGMNTSDVRDMKYKQWIFWATAIPLLALLVFLCLVWAGELSNFWSGFQNLWKAGNKVRKGMGRKVGGAVVRNRQFPGDVGMRPMGIAMGDVRGGLGGMGDVARVPVGMEHFIKSDMRMPETGYGVGVYPMGQAGGLQSRGISRRPTQLQMDGYESRGPRGIFG